MGKEVRVKAHNRRGKNGKSIRVKAHTAKRECGSCSKKGAGCEYRKAKDKKSGRSMSKDEIDRASEYIENAYLKGRLSKEETGKAMKKLHRMKHYVGG